MTVIFPDAKFQQKLHYYTTLFGRRQSSPFTLYTISYRSKVLTQLDSVIYFLNEYVVSLMDNVTILLIFYETTFWLHIMFSHVLNRSVQSVKILS